MNPLINSLTVPVYQGTPPEAWERVLSAWRSWWRRHSRLALRIAAILRIMHFVAIPLVLVAVVVIPRLAVAMVPGIFMTLDLIIIVWLARTRTVSWRSVSSLYGVGVSIAVAAAMVTGAVVSMAGMSVTDEGAAIALAAFIEEPAKMLPLLVVAVVAPGRVRRFATVDWALLGFASGAGFTVAEDSARRLQRPGLLDMLLGETRFHYSLNPWASGSYSNYDGAMTVGHQVRTMSVAMAVALGIAIWRSHGGRMPTAARRLLAWLLPVSVAAQTITNHAGWNATAALAQWTEESGLGFPLPMKLMWQLGGQGHLEIPMSLALFGACLLVDAHRRAYAGIAGWTLEVPVRRYPALAGAPQPVRAVVIAAVALVGYTRADLAVVQAARRDWREGRVRAILRGRTTAEQVRGVRADAMAATTPGVETGARIRFRLVALATGVLAVVLCLALGVRIAQDIGTWLSTDGGLFFAGLLELLGQWWDGLSHGEQILLMTIGVLALALTTGYFWTSLGAMGVVTWVLEHGQGLGAFVRNPVTAVRDYARTITPWQFARDIGDFLLTFAPTGILSRAGWRYVGYIDDQLTWARGVRQYGADMDEMRDLFALRADRIAARKAAETRLRSILPEGYDMSQFTRKRLKETLASLERRGFSKRYRVELERAADSLSASRNGEKGITEYIGARGGEQALAREGLEVPGPFRARPDAGPGPYTVDSLARSYERRPEVVVPEFKGGSARVSTTPVRTLYEGRAPQMTAPYVRDRMLRDKRVIQYFHDNPALWESVKKGDATLSMQLFSTPEPGIVYAGERIPFDMTPTIAQAIDEAIAALP